MLVAGLEAFLVLLFLYTIAGTIVTYFHRDEIKYHVARRDPLFQDTFVMLVLLFVVVFTWPMIFIEGKVDE